MKLLYLDVDAQYLNPTATLLPALISAVGDTRCYGPGFSSPEELRQGIRRWVDANGPFDAVVLGSFVPFLTEEPAERARAASFVRQYTVAPRRYGIGELVQYFDDVLGALRTLPIPLKVISSLSLDSYNSTAAQVERVLEEDVLVIGPNHQLARSMAEWPAGLIEREAHYRRKRDRLTDAWFDFLSNYPQRVLTACHYIAEAEFCFTGVATRQWDIAVPGVEYALRRDALASLAASGHRLAPKRYFHAFRVANRAGLPVYRHHLTVRLYQHLFQRTLMRSRLVFTAPGGSGIVLRKFFEIPAAGAVLVCVPCKGFEALGFADGRNCFVADPGDLAARVAAIGANPRLQRVADAGRELVMRRHSLPARAAQVAQCLEAARAGTYRGAQWSDGEFVVSSAVAAA